MVQNKDTADGVKAPAAKKAKSKLKDDKADVSGIKLDGEEVQRVPVYDDCNEVRRKINAHLRNTAATQAGFCREIVKTFNDEHKKIQGKQLADFLKKKGDSSGAESCVYYAAYVYMRSFAKRTMARKGRNGRRTSDSSRVDCLSRIGLTFG